MALVPFSSVEDLVSALESIDGLPTEDVVAALPHLLQTAEALDADHGDDPELVAAGLVHDLASALELGCPEHAAVGAALVAPLLGPRVADLVAGHAEAKRYLVTVEPDYAVGLSANSTFTLVGQGGTMDADEVAAFAGRPDVAALVALRRADDAAKVPGAPTRTVDSWRPLLDHVAATTATTDHRHHRHRHHRASCQPSDSYGVVWLTGFTTVVTVISSARPWEGAGRQPDRGGRAGGRAGAARARRAGRRPLSRRPRSPTDDQLHLRGAERRSSVRSRLPST